MELSLQTELLRRVMVLPVRGVAVAVGKCSLAICLVNIVFSFCLVL